MNSRLHVVRCAFLIGAAALVLAGCERPPAESVQRGYRGTGMDEIYNPRAIAQSAAANVMPTSLAAVPAGGPAASLVFKNVKVLKDVSVGEFTRTMLAMTSWVAPEQGCSYCHDVADLSSDAKYTKVVARRMLEMTRHINGDWTDHVASTGVTCFTCHRGQNIPANVWFAPAPDPHELAAVGSRAGQNAPATSVALSALPNDPFTPFLLGDADVRVVGPTALQSGNRRSIKQTEGTYGLMMHMSSALGVNCTYCHNTRSFQSWETSTPQRATAWYGIRMARDLNTSYLEPLTPVFPPARHGPTGDVAKVNCTTCHQGAYKPLFGASMAKDYPALQATPTPPATVAVADTPTTPAPIGKP